MSLKGSLGLLVIISNVVRFYGVYDVQDQSAMDFVLRLNHNNYNYMETRL